MTDLDRLTTYALAIAFVAVLGCLAYVYRESRIPKGKVE